MTDLCLYSEYYPSICDCFSQDADAAFLDISKTLFWQGYNIWKARKVLNKKFWKEIAPREWKKTSRPKRRTSKRKMAEIEAAEKCKNPFHYLTRHA
jgi:hypothetical protein